VTRNTQGPRFMSMNKILLLLLTLTLVFVTVRADSGVVLPALAGYLHQPRGSLEDRGRT
jgi:hypothetical protein